jgi:hypothetical protein
VVLEKSSEFSVGLPAKDRIWALTCDPKAIGFLYYRAFKEAIVLLIIELLKTNSLLCERKRAQFNAIAGCKFR